MTKKISISRPVNGISLNGDEYLLNKDNTVKTFDSVVEAKNFLLEKGYTEKEIDSLKLDEYNVAN